MSIELRAICPNCDSITQSGRQDPKFYVNQETGLGYCHHCGFKGKFEEEQMNNLNVVSINNRPSFDQSLLNELEPFSEEAERYLTKRFPGVNKSLLSELGLAYSRKHHAIAIPLGNGLKYRYISPINDQRYGAETGSQFGGYWLDGGADKLLIVEGEFDAITAKLCDFKGTILALQTNKISQESINRLRTFKHVFIALDNDKAGAEGTALIETFVSKSIQFLLPDGIKDLNQLLQERGLDEASKLIKLETRTDLERDTRSLADSVPELVSWLSDSRNTSGDTTGWKTIDHLLGGGLRASELTLFVAFAKVGKSSFLNNIIHNLAAINKKVAVASFEMDPARTLYPSLLSIAAQTNVRRIAPEDLEESVRLIHSDCAYLSNVVTLKRFGTTAWSEIEEWAALMKEQHGIEYLVLDHAGFLTPNMTDAEQNQTLAKNIKKLTLTLGIHILCVVQAPKSKDGLSIQTAYGGMAWSQNCDSFFILERDKDNDLLLKIRLEAARYPGSNPSNTPTHLYYDRDTGTLSE